MKKHLPYILCLLWILSEAISEAMFDQGLKMWSKIVQSGMIVFPFMILYFGRWSLYLDFDIISFTKKFIYLVCIYFIERILFFNIAYNLAAGLEWNYIGVTEVFPKWLILLFQSAPVMIGLAFLLVILIIQYIEAGRTKIQGLIATKEPIFERLFKISTLTLVVFGWLHFIFIDPLFKNKKYYFKLKHILFIMTLALSVIVFGAMFGAIIKALIVNL
jgi:hypothetical protein